MENLLFMLQQKEQLGWAGLIWSTEQSDLADSDQQYWQ